MATASKYPIMESSLDIRNFSGNISGGLTSCQPLSDPSLFIHGSLALSLLILAGFSFLEKRKSWNLSCCWGRPAIVAPINLLDDFEHRWAYACAFGAITNTIVMIFLGTGNFIAFPEEFWAQVVTAQLVSVEICLNFFPFFVCINTKHGILGNIVGLLYTGLWFYVHISIVVPCADEFAPARPYIGLVVQLPCLVCLGVLILRFTYKLGEAIYRCAKKINTDEGHQSLAKDWQINYVHDLMEDNPKRYRERYEKTIGCCQRFKLWVATYIYESRPSFRYSTRILCTLFVVFCCTYQLGAIYFWLNTLIIDWYSQVAEQIINITGLPINSSTVNNIELSTRLISVGWDIVTSISLLLFSVNILMILGRYRQNSVQLYKGDRSFLPNDFATSGESENEEVLRCCMLFAGFQIGHMIWGMLRYGFFIVNLVLWIIALLFMFIIILPLANGITSIVAWLAELLIIPFVFNFLLRLLQKVMANQLFLQDKIKKDDKNKPLALDNLRFFHVMNYFFFLANIQTGLFSCLFRIIKGLVFGLIFLGRLDRCVLMSGMETGDKGYMAYLGMLYTEEAHNHPVLRVFCQIMSNVTKKDDQEGASVERKKPEKLCHSAKSSAVFASSVGSVTVDLSGTHTSEQEEQLHSLPEKSAGNVEEDGVDSGRRRGNRARQRWYLAYTLIHNPFLVGDRRSDPEMQLLDNRTKDKNGYNTLPKSNTYSKEDIINSAVALSNVEIYHRLRDKLVAMELRLYGKRIRGSRRHSAELQTCTPECLDGTAVCEQCMPLLKQDEDADKTGRQLQRDKHDMIEIIGAEDDLNVNGERSAARSGCDDTALPGMPVVDTNCSPPQKPDSENVFTTAKNIHI